MEKKKKETVKKEDFIAYLSSMNPGEINELIEKKGKPPRKICPMFFYPSDK